jgi:hypothetical protein
MSNVLEVNEPALWDPTVVAAVIARASVSPSSFRRPEAFTVELAMHEVTVRPAVCLVHFSAQLAQASLLHRRHVGSTRWFATGGAGIGTSLPTVHLRSGTKYPLHTAFRDRQHLPVTLADLHRTRYLHPPGSCCAQTQLHMTSVDCLRRSCRLPDLLVLGFMDKQQRTRRGAPPVEPRHRWHRSHWTAADRPSLVAPNDVRIACCTQVSGRSPQKHAEAPDQPFHCR